ncbi:signal-regulatory protein beta-1-like [Zootoca vivipara]|uniref:signal-regulatory protein beta-1-like n=1 Tax=Zootoca vivipara TaxID=8524 RepID=UPI00293C0A53|nr:signal-regulatory protein beta-1-like [Zootoca vivipara]
MGSFPGSPRSFLLLLLLQMLGAKGQDLEVLQPPGPLCVSAGENLILTCTVSGNGPPGGVIWHKGLGRNQPTIFSGRGQSPPRVTRVVPGSQTDFTILIRNIRPEDAGTYYCVKYRAGARDIEYKSGGGTEVSVIDHFLLSSFGLFIGLILANKLIVLAPFLIYLFLKK